MVKKGKIRKILDGIESGSPDTNLMLNISKDIFGVIWVRGNDFLKSENEQVQDPINRVNKNTIIPYALHSYFIATTNYFPFSEITVSCETD